MRLAAVPRERRRDRRLDACRPARFGWACCSCCASRGAATSISAEFAFHDDHRNLVGAIEDVADDRPKKKREYGVAAALARLGYAVHDN